MTRLFAQVDVGFLHSDLADALRSELGLSADEAIGKMTRFWHAVLQARIGGDVGGRTDDWIEDSVGWRGKKGAFAGVIRRKHLENGVVIGWLERYGKYDRKRDRDRRSQAAMRERKRLSEGKPATVTANVSDDIIDDISADESLTDEGKSAHCPLSSSSSLVSYPDKGTVPVNEPVGREEGLDALAQAVQQAGLVPEQFGADWQFVELLIRAARAPRAVAATMRAMLAGMNGPQYLAAEIGLAAREYAASGESFKAQLFRGFVRKARIAVQRAGNEQRSARESAYIDHEATERERARREEAEASGIIEDFKRREPEPFEKLRAKAEVAIGAKVSGKMRELMVRAELLRLIRETSK